MTTAVEALLGLDVDQFNRTVVLPQGEFADFLHDKPGQPPGDAAPAARPRDLPAHRPGGTSNAAQRARNQIDALQPDVDAASQRADRRAAGRARRAPIDADRTVRAALRRAGVTAIASSSSVRSTAWPCQLEQSDGSTRLLASRACARTDSTTRLRGTRTRRRRSRRPARQLTDGSRQAGRGAAAVEAGPDLARAGSNSASTSRRDVRRDGARRASRRTAQAAAECVDERSRAADAVDRDAAGARRAARPGTARRAAGDGGRRRRPEAGRRSTHCWVPTQRTGDDRGRRRGAEAAPRRRPAQARPARVEAVAAAGSAETAASTSSDRAQQRVGVAGLRRPARRRGAVPAVPAGGARAPRPPPRRGTATEPRPPSRTAARSSSSVRPNGRRTTLPRSSSRRSATVTGHAGAELATTELAGVASLDVLARPAARSRAICAGRAEQRRSTRRAERPLAATAHRDDAGDASRCHREATAMRDRVTGCRRPRGRCSHSAARGCAAEARRRAGRGRADRSRSPRPSVSSRSDRQADDDVHREAETR